MTEREKDSFDEAFQEWATVEPSTPADEAARQVMARLPEARAGTWRGGSRLRWAAVAAGLAAVLVGVWATLSGPREPESAVALPPLQENVVLLWLDQETPLYLTVAPPATEGDPR